MQTNTNYRLNQHHKFQREGRKYIADLETNDIIQVNDVEWDILSRYGTQTHYQIVEALKEKYKTTAVFDGITRLEQLGKHGQLLTRMPKSERKPCPAESIDRKLRLLVPFDFANEKSDIDYITNLNRYHLLTSLAEVAELETLTFSQGTDAERPLNGIQNFGGLQIRQIHVEEGDIFSPAWYAKDGCDGLLLLSQFSTDDLLYYQIRDVPIIHCIESNQELQSSMLERLLQLHAAQKTTDRLVVKASWTKDWLMEAGIPEENIDVVPDGINVAQPIDKALAKQHTAAIFEKPTFAEQPIVGLISGFEPNSGVQWISAFARANPHLSIFVYDAVLAEHCKDSPENVVIFGADDAEMAAVLPIFLQALDVVCFPAMPGTPLSVILEAMAYGTPCIAMTKYGMPPEVHGAGVSIKSQWDNYGNFRVSTRELSATIHQWLQPSMVSLKSEEVAANFIEKYTWQKTARKINRLFEESVLTDARTDPIDEPLFPPIFCRSYSPDTGTTTSCAYRLGVNRYEHLEKALAETLVKQHKPSEVASVFKHFNAQTPVFDPLNACDEDYPYSDTKKPNTPVECKTKGYQR